MSPEAWLLHLIKRINFMKSNVSLDAIPRFCVVEVIGSFGGGGAQRLAYNLTLGITKHGIRSLGIAMRDKGSYAQLDGGNASIISLGAMHRNPISILRALFALRALINQERVDLIHVHGATSLPLVFCATRFMRKAPKLVFTWHDSESVLEGKGVFTRIMIRVLQRCDSVSGSSRLVAQRLIDRARLNDAGVFHGGVPVSNLTKTYCSTDPLILWLGRIVPSKDPHILLRAAARLRSEGLQFKLCIAGAPIPTTTWFWEETCKLVRYLKLDDIVSMPGFVSGSELQDIMLRAEIGVQTSHTEGLSLALMEQMMAGIVLVATDVGDTSMAINDEINGFLIRPRDEDQLTDVLRKLLKSPELRKKCAIVGRVFAEEHLSIDSMVSRATAQYLELISRGVVR